jgi:hypothetical protein
VADVLLQRFLNETNSSRNAGIKDFKMNIAPLSPEELDLAGGSIGGALAAGGATLLGVAVVLTPGLGEVAIACALGGIFLSSAATSYEALTPQ